MSKTQSRTGFRRRRRCRARHGRLCWVAARGTPGRCSPACAVTARRGRKGAVDRSVAQQAAVVVNFWATWCAPCREEMPEFVRAQTEYGARGVQFVGIAVDEADKVDRFAKELGLNYPTLIGGYGAVELSKTLGNRLAALPLRSSSTGKGASRTLNSALKPDQLRAIVGKLL